MNTRRRKKEECVKIVEKELGLATSLRLGYRLPK